ncbi:hypothetical protein OIU85_029675 [Salix viminalis]|uniref:Uncharacterized protein n=1 Tax=Salix viminalis TaxID=40686 RepID=A0A9Q0QBW1_SALVM|nr:hypothetical protein OIU85_029675 [Salix viminalis]
MTYSMRSPPNPNFSNPHASTRVQKPQLVIEKGRLVKLHKVEILPLRSFTVSTGLFLYFHNQRHLSIKSRGNAYSHIRKELFLGFRGCRSGGTEILDVAGLMDLMEMDP